MSFGDIVIYACLIILVLYITRINNMWGVSKGTKKVKVDVAKSKSTVKKRKRYLFFLNLFEWVEANVGVSLSKSKEADYRYKIDRLDYSISILSRTIKPKELVGGLRLLGLLVTLLGVLGWVITGKIAFLLLILGLTANYMFVTYMDMQIVDLDKKLEDYFPDLYLLLYNKLLKGTRDVLAPTLENYLISLNAMYGSDNTSVIKRFVLDLRSNIDIYGDDGMAINHLRDKYRSAMVINFTNLAVQALNGVDNSDKLLAFKIELNQRKLDFMNKRADKLVKKGGYAVYTIYVILFQFVLLSWIAKLSVSDGGIMNILGNVFGR
ncbi:hypothetical protein D3C71_1128830 [compost metagenome]